MGRSGSGKSTLLRCINRLNDEIDGFVIDGKIDILTPKKIDILNFDISTLRQNIGVVFQVPHVLPFSIYKNVSLALDLNTTLSKDEIFQKVKDSLINVGLWEECKDRLDTLASNLSGGQQQRLCFARALALNPSVLLLDEPTSSLDIHSSLAIESLIEKLGKEYIIVLVTHSIEQAIRLCDSIAILQNGKIVKEFCTQDIENVNVDELKDALKNERNTKI